MVFFSGGQCSCTAEKFPCLTTALRTQHPAPDFESSPSQTPNKFGAQKVRHQTAEESGMDNLENTFARH
jgi:hypothetical protein